MMENVVLAYNNAKLIILSFALLLLAASNSIAFSDTRFSSPTDKGNFGEEVTRQQMDFRGYSQLPSKITGNQGIDHVFVRRNKDGSVKDIIVAETKTDSSPLKSDQMSDSKIDKQIERMKNSKDPEVRKTGELLAKNRGKIRKEHWHHDTKTGKTTVYELGSDGKPVATKAEYSTKKAQKQIMARRNRAKPKSNANQQIIKQQSTKRKWRTKTRKRVRLKLPRIP